MINASTLQRTDAPMDWSGQIGVQSLSLTAVAVGFFFSFRAILVLISARWLNLGTEPGVAASLTIEFFLLLTIVFQGIGPGARLIRSIVQQASVRWVLIFLGFSCCSLLWSATASPSASFLYWCGMAADVAIVLLLVRIGAASAVASSLMRGFIWSTCVLAVIAWMMPTQSDFRLGDQDYFNTNQIGNLCAIAIFMAQFLHSRHDGKWRAEIPFLSITLIRSLSKATIIAFVLGEIFLLIYDKSISGRKKVGVLLASAVLLLGFWGLIGSYFDLYTTTGNQAETLTGRTAIWAYTLDVALDKPWIGNGIDAMWKVFPPFGKEQFEARHAENELLQQFFAYGVAGLVMLGALYGSLWRRIVALPRGRSKGILISIILFIIVRGMAEAEPFDLLLPLWMITLISCIADRGQETSQGRDVSGLAIAAAGIERSPAL